jgi:hypothetical protein
MCDEHLDKSAESYRTGRYEPHSTHTQQAAFS